MLKKMDLSLPVQQAVEEGGCNMQRFRIWTLVVCAVVAATLYASSAFAQNATGTIVGHITDQSGAVIPNVNVEIKNSGTGQVRVMSASDVGDYTATLLQPGNYEVTASTAGFKIGVLSDITVEVERTVRADFTLVVGNQTQHVEVSAQALSLDTDSATVGGVVFERQVTDLPLNGRRFFDLLFVTSAAVQTGGEQSDFRYGAGDAIAIAGARSSSNGYTIDGTGIMDTNYNTPAYNPSLDAIQEFRVQTKTYSAEYGYSVNQINISTKSGTNGLHGSVYEYLRNDKLDARDFFNVAPLPVNPLRQNQFGASLGGPVFLPKVYNGRDKTFFFVNYEGQRIRQSQTAEGNVPPPEMLQGKFPFPVTDPATGEVFPQQDGMYVIPPQKISRFAQIVQKNPTLFWPAPNATGEFNFIGSTHSTVSNDQGTFRIDQKLSERDHVFVRGTISNITAIIPTTLAPVGDEAYLQNSRNYTVTYTRSFTPTLLNQFRYGYLNATSYQTTYPISQADLSFLDLKGTFSKMPDLTYPGISLGTYPLIPNASIAYAGSGGSGLTPFGTSEMMNDLSDSLSWAKGKHTVGVGFGIRWWVNPMVTSDRPLGGFSYDGEFSGGNSISDFLLGYTTGSQPHLAGPLGNINTGVLSRFHYKSWAPYIQDDWRVTPKLTLNLGLRYEYQHIPSEESNDFFWLDPNIPGGGLYCADPKVVEQYGGGLYGYNGMRGPGPSRKNYFAPRLGFAVRPFGDDKTVLRGGYGLFFDTQQEGEWFASGNFWPYASAANFVAHVATGTLLNTDDLYPLPGTGPVTKDVLGFLEIQGPGVRTPYIQDWSFGIQRQLFANTTLDVSYTGNKGTALENRGNPNQPTQCNAAHNCDPLAQTPATITARRAYPNLGTMVLSGFDGNSNYHALDVKVEHRGTDLTYLAVYTWSKGLDIKSAVAGVSGDTAGWSGVQDFHNQRADYGLSSYDVSQRLAMSFVYNLPVGRGKAALKNASKVADTVVGGWQVNGIAVFQGGFPFSIVASDLGFVNEGYGERADLVGNPHTGFTQSIHKWFNTAAFAQPAAGEFGNSGRNIIRSPGVNNFDLSLFKNFKLSERARLQFRLESFNALNHPQFGFPDVNVNSSTFGVISTISKYHTARRNQIALRIDF